MKEKWLRLNELENAIDSLEMADHFLECIPSEMKWKWVIIAIHQALYGFAICSIRGTDARWLIDKHSKKGEVKLISIWESLKRAKDPHWMPLGISQSLVTTPEEDTAIKRIISEFRNEFEHFLPKHWSIEVSGMPTILRHILRVLSFLSLESCCVLYSTDDEKNRVKQVIDKLEKKLSDDVT